MHRPDAYRRLRERLVLGPVRAVLEADEEVVAWGHVQAPPDGRHGIIAFTKFHCVVHWLARDQDDAAVAWQEVRAWDVEDAPRGGPVLSVRSVDRHLAVRLPVTSKARARKASMLLGWVAELTPASARQPEGFTGDTAYTVQPERRGLRGHTRRVLVTVAGVFLILLGLLFASPFLPGPGALTVLAGLAILASEYDWARDIYNWLKGRIERFWEWRRARRQRRRAVREARTRRPAPPAPEPRDPQAPDV